MAVYTVDEWHKKYYIDNVFVMLKRSVTNFNKVENRE